MYVGHIGAALGARFAAPRAAIGALVFAAYLPDWIDAALCVSGRYGGAQMVSHSMPAVLLLAVLAGGAQLAHRGDATAALVVAAVVLSHVLLDYITGIKPTWPGGPFIGLGIYRQPMVDFVVEGAVIFAGWLCYRRTLPPGLGRWNAAHLMLALLLLMQAGIDAGRFFFPVVDKC